jgi:hypothetical protein
MFDSWGGRDWGRRAKGEVVSETVLPIPPAAVDLFRVPIQDEAPVELPSTRVEAGKAIDGRILDHPEVMVLENLKKMREIGSKNAGVGIEMQRFGVRSLH